VSVNQSSVSGFLADTGRLPQSVAELTTNDPNSSGIQTYTTQLGPIAFSWSPVVGNTSGNSANIFVSGGWNGPYLLPAISQTSIIDAWNNPILLQPTDASGNPTIYPDLTVPGSGAVYALSGGSAAGYTHAQDSLGSTTDLAMPLSAASMQASSLTVLVQPGKTLPSTSEVALFGPVPGSAPQLPNGATMLGVGCSTQSVTGGSASFPSFALANIAYGAASPQVPLIGSRVLCLLDTANKSGMYPTLLVGPVYVVLSPGANQVIIAFP